MATILLLGNPHVCAPAAEVFSSHTVFAFAYEDVPYPENLRVTELTSAEELPEHIDAIFELSTGNPEEQWLNFEEIAECIERSGALFVNVLTTTATAVASEFASACPVIGISYLPTEFSGATVLEAAPALQCTPEQTTEAITLLASLTGKQIEQVQDRVALVSARILAMVVNEAVFALMEQVADAADIDTAMKLGTNYPEGPLRWCDRIGADVIVSILDALHDEYGEERYRPCVMLKQYARAEKRFCS